MTSIQLSRADSRLRLAPDAGNRSFWRTMALLWLTWPMLAHAVDSEPTSEFAALSEITVTAQLRQENVQSVPITVDTVSAADAKDRGTISIQSLSATIPNLTFTAPANTTNTYIRGVGDNSATVNNEPSAAVYVDGVYNAASLALTTFNFNNIEQIEVLKGPQGTLFGRNATAGVIQILTPDPKHSLSGRVEAGYANYNTTSANGYITGGLSDTLAADLALLWDNQASGYGRNLTTGRDSFRNRDFAARSKWLFEPVDSTKLRLILDYAKSDTDGICDHFVPGSVPPYIGRYNCLGGDPLNNNVQWGASVRWDQDLGESLHAVSITSYRDVTGDWSIDSDNTAAPKNQIITHFDARYWTEELQLTNRNPGRITWLLGAFYYGNQVFAADPWTQFGTGVAGGYRSYIGSQDTSSGSIFGQATADLVADTKFTVGLRYTYETLQANTQALDITQQPVAGPFRQNLRSDPVTWRFALDHQFTNDVLGYISYNRGFKSGGYNLVSPGSAPFLPEHVDACEIGLKSEWLDRRLRLNIAGFYYDYTDLQVAVVLGGAQLFENAAAARNFGMDASIDFAATERLTLSTGIGLLNAKYKDYPGARGYTPLGVAIPIANAKGADLPYAPPITGFVTGDYRLPTAIGDFSSSITVSYSDRSFVTPDMGLQRPAYTMLNASLSWNPAFDKSLTLRLWGRNLTNAEYFQFASESANGWYVADGAPRTYGVSVKKEF